MRYDTNRITSSQDKAFVAQAESRHLAVEGACAQISRSPAPTVRRTWRVRGRAAGARRMRAYRRSQRRSRTDRTAGRPQHVVGHDHATHAVERPSRVFAILPRVAEMQLDLRAVGAHIEMTSCRARDRLTGVDRDARALARERLGEGYRRGAGERADLEHAARTRRPHQRIEEPHLLDGAAIPGKASPSGPGSAARRRADGRLCTCPHTAQRRTRPAIASARHRRRDHPGRRSRTPPEVVCSKQ